VGGQRTRCGGARGRTAALLIGGGVVLLLAYFDVLTK
jgi:hypothetical protein